MDEHFINQAVIAGLLGRHKVIPLRIPLNGFQRLARHLAEHPVHPLFGAQDIFGVDFDIRGLALYAAQRLVNHNFAVGQGKPLPLGAGGKEEGPHE